ncbi:aminodeoxychorismate synthase, component I [Sphingomonas oleivorans]|uniref:Probable branched-chain-amino-acid aminotransferase n=1 Tax=Sphingomonas oleivorans TaxID=1735121 RepID=A0A2T5FU46_9SPHN|nr:aminodeoxychorismate synthase component I [Sphingomonas oleivorans]PTQ07800.1 aminodeoxychorismate synthase, component I [Sphingomonas oleivorans]
MIPRDRPFVLLDDARVTAAAPARLFVDPAGIVVARAPGEVAPALERLRETIRGGRHAAGWIGYEAGHALEPKLGARADGTAADGAPLLWFGLFDRVETIAADAVPALLPDPAGAWAGTPRPLVSRTDYEAAVARILAFIAAGDIYQANLSFRATVRIAGHPLALYARLRAASRAGWGGLIFTGDHWLLSLSPELFFTLDGGRLTTRPMKGTAPRLMDPAADAAAVAALAADPKQRAENLMIVDLLRNDLARVAAPGSVSVPALFEIETYPTVHQMTSTVTAELAEGHDAVDVLAALFPCGSVTGAPKIRAMEIIAETESSPRGAYTGSIGWLAPEGGAAFNVAIRTIMLRQGEDHGLIGLGSGIVADSTAAAEWDECRAKGAFVTAGARPFDLIETMRFDAHDGIVDLERHIARMKASACALGFRFDHHALRNELQAATFRLQEDMRLRMRLSPSGAVAIEASRLPEPPMEEGRVAVAIASLPVDRADFRLRHKTSDRSFYDAARAAGGAFETLFVCPEGYVTEGSFTNVFVERRGRLVTPPLSRGLLPGILRARLIEEGRAVEGDVRPDDLRKGFLLGNALRGLILARLAQAGL